MYTGHSVGSVKLSTALKLEIKRNDYPESREADDNKEMVLREKWTVMPRKCGLKESRTRCFKYHHCENAIPYISRVFNYSSPV